MNDRILHASGPAALNDLADARHAETPNGGGDAAAILGSSHRVVLKNGRVSGARACALSARAARADLAGPLKA